VGDTCVLPDPAHALWGLLDHHPQGEGALRLPDGDWDEALPPARVAMLRWCESRGRGALGARLRRVARGRLLEAARRRVVAHAVVAGTRVGGSILAALLGRGFRVADTADAESATRIAAYWASWRAMVADEGGRWPPGQERPASIAGGSALRSAAAVGAGA